MVLGVVGILLYPASVIMGPVCLLSIFTSITGIVLGSVSMYKASKTGIRTGVPFALAGLIMNGLAFFLFIIGLILALIFFGYLFLGEW
jgi:hypothetical protein